MTDKSIIEYYLSTLKEYAMQINNLDYNPNVLRTIKFYVNNLSAEGKKNQYEGIYAIEYFNQEYLYEAPNGDSRPYLDDEVLKQLRIYLESQPNSHQ
jgi:hypothetical protein